MSGRYSPRMEKQTVKVGVGVVVLDGESVLLIRRGKAPKAGEWSLPGGHVELGESLRAAAQREVQEETGLSVAIQQLVDVVDLIAPHPDGSVDYHYALVDYWAEPASGTLCAGSDAAEAVWHNIANIGFLGMWHETERIIMKAVQLRDAAHGHA
jgi:8-oxo-dGTP diphosphatase